MWNLSKFMFSHGKIQFNYDSIHNVVFSSSSRYIQLTNRATFQTMKRCRIVNRSWVTSDVEWKCYEWSEHRHKTIKVYSKSGRRMIKRMNWEEKKRRFLLVVKNADCFMFVPEIENALVAASLWWRWSLEIEKPCFTVRLRFSVLTYGY